MGKMETKEESLSKHGYARYKSIIETIEKICNSRQPAEELKGMDAWRYGENWPKCKHFIMPETGLHVYIDDSGIFLSDRKLTYEGMKENTGEQDSPQLVLELSKGRFSCKYGKSRSFEYLPRLVSYADYNKGANCATIPGSLEYEDDIQNAKLFQENDVPPDLVVAIKKCRPDNVQPSAQAVFDRIERINDMLRCYERQNIQELENTIPLKEKQLKKLIEKLEKLKQQVQNNDFSNPKTVLDLANNLRATAEEATKIQEEIQKLRDRILPIANALYRGEQTANIPMEVKE